MDRNNEPIIYRNPIEQKDLIISEQAKEMEDLKVTLAAKEAEKSRTLENKIKSMESSTKHLKSKSSLLHQHLSRSRAVVEMRLVEKIQEQISDPEAIKDEIGFEVTTLAAMLMDDDIEKGVFFDKMKEKLDNNKENELESFEVVKKLVTDRHESLKLQRGRRLSVGKRLRGDSGEERSSSRPRIDQN